VVPENGPSKLSSGYNLEAWYTLQRKVSNEERQPSEPGTQRPVERGRRNERGVASFEALYKGDRAALEDAREGA